MSTWTVILLFGICLTTSVKGTPSYIIEVSEVNSTFNEVVDFTRRAIQSEFPDELLHIVITDIDECESSLLSKCSSFATCKNTEGSHVCECLPGYSDVDLNIPGQNCNDNDECKNGSHNCHRFAVCENTPGNYSCKCNSGYSGDGFVCIDIDECRQRSYSCPMNSGCVNMPGHYGCACLPGYQQTFRNNQFFCTALDDISTGSPASTMSSSESTPRAKTTTMILSEATSSLDTLITTNLQSTEITTMLETMLPTEFTSSTQSVMDMISSETTKQRETVSLPTITKSRPTSLETSLSLVSTTSQLTTPSSGLTTIALNRTESTTNPTTPMFSTNGTLPEESVPAISSTRSQSTIVIEPTSNTIATSTSIATLPTTGTFNPTTPALSTYETMTTVKATPTISSTQFQSINTVESTSNMIGTSAPVSSLAITKASTVTEMQQVNATTFTSSEKENSTSSTHLLHVTTIGSSSYNLTTQSLITVSPFTNSTLSASSKISSITTSINDATTLQSSVMFTNTFTSQSLNTNINNNTSARINSTTGKTSFATNTSEVSSSTMVDVSNATEITNSGQTELTSQLTTNQIEAKTITQNKANSITSSVPSYTVVDFATSSPKNFTDAFTDVLNSSIATAYTTPSFNARSQSKNVTSGLMTSKPFSGTTIDKNCTFGTTSTLSVVENTSTSAFSSNSTSLSERLKIMSSIHPTIKPISETVSTAMSKAMKLTSISETSQVSSHSMTFRTVPSIVTTTARKTENFTSSSGPVVFMPSVLPTTTLKNETVSNSMRGTMKFTSTFFATTQKIESENFTLSSGPVKIPFSISSTMTSVNDTSHTIMSQKTFTTTVPSTLPVLTTTIEKTEPENSTLSSGPVVTTIAPNTNTGTSTILSGPVETTSSIQVTVTPTSETSMHGRIGKTLLLTTSSITVPTNVSTFTTTARKTETEDQTNTTEEILFTTPINLNFTSIQTTPTSSVLTSLSQTTTSPSLPTTVKSTLNSRVGTQTNPALTSMFFSTSSHPHETSTSSTTSLFTSVTSKVTSPLTTAYQSPAQSTNEITEPVSIIAYNETMTTNTIPHETLSFTTITSLANNVSTIYSAPILSTANQTSVITNTQGVTTIPTGIFKPPILTPENIALQARMFVLSINNLLQSGHLVAADAGAIGSSLSSFLNSGVTISTEVAGLLVDVQNSFFTAVGTFSKPPNPADASKLTNITIQLTEEMKLDFGNYEKNSSTVSIKAQDSTIEELQETGEPLVYVNDGGEIMLPIDFIQSAAQVTANKTDRFAFNQFVDSRMHIDPQVSSIIAKQAANGNLSLQADTTFVNSPIVSASIAGKPIIDSQSFAEIRLKKLATPPAPIPADNSTSVVTRYRNPRCVWWDYSLNNGSGEWSDRGCQFLENGPEFISCRCNHLTSFAVIMTVEVTVDDQILTILTYVGCALSIAGLLFTILTYSIFKVLRKHKSKRILLHFCTALCCVYISYLLGIATNIPNTQAQCIASGFFLHYFTLTVMAWMCVEVVDMYLLFVKIWTSFRKYVLKASLLAWGVPFILSIITLGVHFALEGRDTYQGGRRVYPLYEDGTICWLASDGLLYAFVIPSCILLTINLILFVIVLYHITCKRKLRRVRSTTRPIKARQHVINATALLLLAGPTWIIGYFINIEPIADGVFRRGLSYVFVFLNAFQGLWIFLIFSIRPVIVRRLWSELIFKGKFLDTSQTSSRSWSQGTRRNTVSTIAVKSQAVASNVVFEVRSGSTTKSEEENEDNSFSNANA